MSVFVRNNLHVYSIPNLSVYACLTHSRVNGVYVWALAK